MSMQERILGRTLAKEEIETVGGADNGVTGTNNGADTCTSGPFGTGIAGDSSYFTIYDDREESVQQQ